ncbi:MAG TPA: hypothetical protein VGM80_14945 [Gaiellaceae bacterium]
MTIAAEDFKVAQVFTSDPLIGLVMDNDPKHGVATLALAASLCERPLP